MAAEAQNPDRSRSLRVCELLLPVPVPEIATGRVRDSKLACSLSLFQVADPIVCLLASSSLAIQHRGNTLIMRGIADSCSLVGNAGDRCGHAGTSANP